MYILTDRLLKRHSKTEHSYWGAVGQKDFFKNLEYYGLKLSKEAQMKVHFKKQQK